MAKNAQVKVELNAVDRATRVFQKVGKEADALKGKLDGMGSRVSGVLAGAGAGALGQLRKTVPAHPRCRD